MIASATFRCRRTIDMNDYLFDSIQDYQDPFSNDGNEVVTLRVPTLGLPSAATGGFLKGGIAPHGKQFTSQSQSRYSNCSSSSGFAQIRLVLSLYLVLS